MHRKRVLVVDDHCEIRSLALNVLAAQDYCITEARSAAEAIAILSRDAAFDLIVADVVMPGACNGVDLAKDVSRHWPDIPVVLMSGDPYGIKLAAREQRLSFLRKPFRSQEFALRVAETLARRSDRPVA